MSTSKDRMRKYRQRHGQYLRDREKAKAHTREREDEIHTPVSLLLLKWPRVRGDS